jgi:hypothetical protein
MSDDAEEDPDTAADRLEAALERIAHLSASRPEIGPRPSTGPLDHPEPDLSIPEIAARLDSLIARLRAALGGEAKAQ